MRFPLHMATLAVCLIVLQCTASTPGVSGEPGLPGAGSEASSPPGGGDPVSGSPPNRDQPEGPSGAQSRDQPRGNGGGASRSGDSSTGGDGKPISDELSGKTQSKTTTTTVPNAPPANTPTKDLLSAPEPAAPEPGVTHVTTKTTEAAGTNEQTHAQAQLTHTNTDQTDTEGKAPSEHTVKKPTLPDVPPVSPAPTKTTTISPAAATLSGAADPERPQERVLADNTLTIGGPTQQQTDRLGQPQPNTAINTRIEAGTQHPPPVTPQDPEQNPAGTTVVSVQPPKTKHDTGYNQLAKTTDPKLSSPATTPQLKNPVTGQTPPTNAAAGGTADPVTAKTTTPTKSSSHDGQNQATTDSGIQNKIHALTLKSTTSTTVPEDSPQTSLTSTTESAKEESTAAANNLTKLSETLQQVDLKDGSIRSSLLSTLTALVTLTVMAVAQVS